MSDTNKKESMESQTEDLVLDGELTDEELEQIAGGIRRFGMGMLPPSLATQFRQMAQGDTTGAAHGHHEVAQPDAQFEQGSNDNLLGGKTWTPQQEVALQSMLQRAQRSPQGRQMLQSMQQQMRQAQLQGAAPRAQQPTAPQPPTQQPAEQQKGFELPSWIPGLNVKAGENKTDPNNSWENNKKYGTTKKEADKNKKDGKADSAQSYGPGSFDLNSYGKGATLAEGDVNLLKVGELDAKTSGDWGSLTAKGDTRFLEARGRVYNFANLDLTKGEIALGIGAQGQANLFRANYTGAYETPKATLYGQPVGIKASINTEVRVGAQGDAEASIILGKNPRIKIGAGGFAGARADASAMVEGTALGLSANAKGDAWAWAGAQGEAVAELSKTGLTASVGGFAGASAGVKGSASLAGIGVWGKAEAWAGVGANRLDLCSPLKQA